MTVKFAKFGMLAAFAFASTSALACPGHTAAKGALLTAQNEQTMPSRGDTIQKQTNPKKNGTSQSESRGGENKNGQMQQ
jgi:hypothetical protein